MVGEEENVGCRKSRRRSSILKMPLSLIDANKQVEEKPEKKSRRLSKRVSFANYAEVKEFHEVSLSYNNNGDSGDKKAAENSNKMSDSNKLSEIESLLTGEIKNTDHDVENISDPESEDEIGVAVDPLNRSIMVLANEVQTSVSRSMTISQTIENKENTNVCTINSEVPHVDSVEEEVPTFLEKVMANIPLSSEKSLFPSDFNYQPSMSTELFFHNYINTHTEYDKIVQKSNELQENNSPLNISLFQGNHTFYFDRNDSMDLTKPLGKDLKVCNEGKAVVITNSPENHTFTDYNEENSFGQKTINFNRTHIAGCNMDMTCCNTTFSQILDSETPVENINKKGVENIQNFCENKQFHEDESFCKQAKEFTTHPLKFPAENCMLPSSSMSISQPSNVVSKNITDKENIPCGLNEKQFSNLRGNSNSKDDLVSMTDFRPSITDVSMSRVEKTDLDNQEQHFKTGSKRTCFSETSEIPSKKANTNDMVDLANKKDNLTVFNKLRQPNEKGLNSTLKLSDFICSVDNNLNNSTGPISKKTNFENSSQLMAITDVVPEKPVLTEKIINQPSNVHSQNMIDKENIPAEFNEIGSGKTRKSVEMNHPINFKEMSSKKANDMVDPAIKKDNLSGFNKLRQPNEKGLNSTLKLSDFICSVDNNLNNSTGPISKKTNFENSSQLMAITDAVPEKPVLTEKIINQPSNVHSKNLIDKENIPGEFNEIGGVKTRESVEIERTVLKDTVGSTSKSLLRDSSMSCLQKIIIDSSHSVSEEFNQTQSSKSVVNSKDIADCTAFNKADNFSKLAKEPTINSSQLPTDKLPSVDKLFHQPSNVHSQNMIDKENIPAEFNEIGSGKTRKSVEMNHPINFKEMSSKKANDMVDPAIKKDNLSGFNKLRQPNEKGLNSTLKLSDLLPSGDNVLNNSNGPILKKTNIKSPSQSMTITDVVPEKQVLTESLNSHMKHSSMSCSQKILADPSQSVSEELSQIQSNKSVVKFNNADNFSKPAKEPTINSSQLPTNKLPSFDKIFYQPPNVHSKNMIDKENIPAEFKEIGSGKISESVEMKHPINFKERNILKDDLVSMTDFRPSITDVSMSRVEKTDLDNQEQHFKTGSKRTCFSETSEIPSKKANANDMVDLANKKDNLSGFNKLRQPNEKGLNSTLKLSDLICSVDNNLNNSTGPISKKTNFENSSQSMAITDAVPEKPVLTEKIINQPSNVHSKNLIDKENIPGEFNEIGGVKTRESVEIGRTVLKDTVGSTSKSLLRDSSMSCLQKIIVNSSHSVLEELNQTQSSKSVVNSKDIADCTAFNKADNFNKPAKEPTINSSQLPTDKLPSFDKLFHQPSNVHSQNMIDKENIPVKFNEIGCVELDLAEFTPTKFTSTSRVSNPSDVSTTTTKTLSNPLLNSTEVVPLPQTGKLSNLSGTNSSQNESRNELPTKNDNISEFQMTNSCLSCPLDQSPARDNVNYENLKNSDTNLNETDANKDILKTKIKERPMGYLELSDKQPASFPNNSNSELSKSSGNCEKEKEALEKPSSIGVTNEKETISRDEMLGEKMKEISKSSTSHLDSVETEESISHLRSDCPEMTKENFAHTNEEIIPPSVQIPYERNYHEESVIRSDAYQTTASCVQAEKLSENGIEDNKTETEKPKLIKTNNPLTKLQNKLFNIGNVIETVKKGEMKNSFSFTDSDLKIDNTDVSNKYHRPQYSSISNRKKENDFSFNISNSFSRRQAYSETINSKLHESVCRSNLVTMNKDSLMGENCIRPDKAVKTDTSGAKYNDGNNVSNKIDVGFDFDDADVSNIMDEKFDSLLENISTEETLDVSPEKREQKSNCQQPSRSASLMTDRSILDIRNGISTLNDVSGSILCNRFLMNMHIPSMERPLSLMEVETIEDLLSLIGIDKLEVVALNCRNSTAFGTAVPVKALSVEEKMELTCLVCPKYEANLRSYQQLKSEEERLLKEFKDPELLYRFRNVLEEMEKTKTKENIKKELLEDFKICRQITDIKMKQKKATFFSDLSSAYKNKVVKMEEAKAQMENITSEFDQSIFNLDEVLKDLDEKIEVLNSKSEHSEDQIKYYREGREYMDKADSTSQKEKQLSIQCTQLSEGKSQLVAECTRLDNIYQQVQNGESPEQLSLEKKFIELDFYSILSPWKLWELQKNVKKFTFWMSTLQLCVHNDSLENITEIYFVIDEVWESVADDHPWLRLAHKMRKANLNTEIFKGCTNISQFSQLLSVYSAEMMKLEDLAKEIHFFSIRYCLKLQNNCITITFCCLKSMSKVTVDFYLDTSKYPLSFIKFEVKKQYGHISCEDITRRLQKVQPGLRYFTRLVNTVDLELTASKF